MSNSHIAWNWSSHATISVNINSQRNGETEKFDFYFHIKIFQLILISDIRSCDFIIWVTVLQNSCRLDKWHGISIKWIVNFVVYTWIHIFYYSKCSSYSCWFPVKLFSVTCLFLIEGGLITKLLRIKRFFVDLPYTCSFPSETEVTSRNIMRNTFFFWIYSSRWLVTAVCIF